MIFTNVDHIPFFVFIALRPNTHTPHTYTYIKPPKHPSFHHHHFILFISECWSTAQHQLEFQFFLYVAYDRNEILVSLPPSLQDVVYSYFPGCIYNIQAYNFYEVTKFTFRTPNGIDPFSSKMRCRRSFFHSVPFRLACVNI